MRGRGGFIGANVTPASAAINSAASGVWTVREAEALKRAGTWPRVFEGPTSVSGLQLWLDASDASTLFDATTGGSLVAADGAVARWEDKSGNARHMTQGTAGSRPTRKTAVQGGLDVLRFDGSNDSMSVASSTATFSFLHSGASTILCVLKVIANTADGSRVFGTRGSGSDRGAQLSHWNSSVTGRFRHGVTNGEASNDDVIDNYSANSFFTVGTFGVVSIVTNTASAAAARSSMRINGGAATANNTFSNAANSGSSSHDFRLCNNPTSTAGVNADICELMIYNSALSGTDRAAVENYLLAKWGIT